MKPLRRFGMILVLLLAGAIVSLLALRAVCQHQVAERIKISSPNGIDSLEKIKLGGVGQWMQIRGEDRTKPILLFLHSGPGFPEMPFSHVNARLDFDGTTRLSSDLLLVARASIREGIGKRQRTY